MALLPFSPPPSPWIKYSDTTRYNIGGSNTGGVGINTNTEAQQSRLDIRLSSTDSLPSMAFKNAGNTMSSGESEYMYVRLGENGNYAGYLKFWPSSGSENSWSLAVHTTPYPGASSKYFFAAPSFNSTVNGRGDVSIMTWTNDASNNFSGYMDIGEPYWFGAAPATYASVNVGIGKTSTSYFTVRQYTDRLDLMKIVGDTGIASVITGGSTTTYANLGGVIFDHYADANNSGTSETDLYTDTIAASTLSQNGHKITAHYQGIFTGAVTATQTLRLYFGGTKIYDSGALSIGAVTANWTATVVCIRVSSSVVRCSVSVNSDFATLFPYSTYTEVTGLTLTNTQILKVTGQAGGAAGASNQITAKEGYVEYKPKA